MIKIEKKHLLLITIFSIVYLLLLKEFVVSSVLLLSPKTIRASVVNFTPRHYAKRYLKMDVRAEEQNGESVTVHAYVPNMGNYNFSKNEIVEIRVFWLFGWACLESELLDKFLNDMALIVIATMFLIFSYFVVFKNHRF